MGLEIIPWATKKLSNKGINCCATVNENTNLGPITINLGVIPLIKDVGPVKMSNKLNS